MLLRELIQCYFEWCYPVYPQQNNNKLYRILNLEEQICWSWLLQMWRLLKETFLATCKHPKWHKQGAVAPKRAVFDVSGSSASGSGRQANWRSCWLVAKSKCRLLQLRMSPFRNPAGIFSSEMSNAKLVGSSGLSCCLNRFTALAMFSGLGSDRHGFSYSTSFKIAEAGLNKFSHATSDKE